MEVFAYVLLYIWARVTVARGALGGSRAAIGVSSGYGGAYGAYGEYGGYGGRAAPVVAFSSPAYVYSPNVVPHFDVGARDEEVAAPASSSGYIGYGSGGSPGYFGYSERSSHPSYHGGAGRARAVWAYASGWW